MTVKELKAKLDLFDDDDAVVVVVSDILEVKDVVHFDEGEVEIKLEL